MTGNTLASSIGDYEIRMTIEPWMLRAGLVFIALCLVTGALLALNAWLERKITDGPNLIQKR